MVTPTGRTNELYSLQGYGQSGGTTTCCEGKQLYGVHGTDELFLQMGYLFVVYQFARLHQ